MDSATTVEVEIERILPGGVGIAHAQGLTIFVSLVAPGDVVRVEIDRTRGKVAFASVKEIIKPSALRVEPPCPYFGRCGGCDFQQMNYEAQLNAKVEIIRDCLHRIAHIEVPPEFEIYPSPQQWHYRARANWQFDPQTKALGYFERGSHRVCDVAECAVLEPALATTLSELREKITSGSLGMPPPESPAGQLGSRASTDIEAVVGDEGVSISPNWGRPKAETVSRKIGAETYYLSAEAFFQINHTLLEPLIAETIQDTRGTTALDLYCGVGLFTLPLARRFERVVGVEANPTASEFARLNVQNAQLPNARIVNARVADWLRDNGRSLTSADLLLLDPPRAGAEPAVVEGVLALRPKQISYVSCDPATLARDLKMLLSEGYALDSVVAFDMFPQTHHVETLARLTRHELETTARTV
ncbi:MAG: class I SAM-dependent RNA methyltransferase [Pyrinomonadaceae bacterium]